MKKSSEPMGNKAVMIKTEGNLGMTNKLESTHTYTEENISTD